MCMSIVASAFQYGWAPTLMPLTTMLISPPSCVKRTIRLQRRGDPVHVLGAGVHRDLRARGEREPLDRHAELLGEVERGDHALALRLGERAERARRVAEQHDAPHALGVALGAVAHQPDHDARAVGRRRPVDRDELPVAVEVVLDELAGRDRGARLRALRGQHLDDLRRVQAAAAARGDDPLGALVERLQRLVRRVAELDGDAAAGGAEDAQRAVALDAVLAHARAELDHLEAEPGARAREAADDLARLGRGEVHRRPGVEQQPVPVQALARRPARLDGAHRLERLAHHPLELGQRGDAAGLVADRREVAHLGERDQPLVARVRVRDGAEQVDVLRRGQPLEVELAQPPHVHPLGHHRVHAADGRVLGERRRRRRARRCARRRRRPPARTRTNTTRATASGQLGRRRAARRGPRAPRAARRRRPARGSPAGIVRACAASARSAAGSSSGSPSVAATWWRRPSRS